MAAVTRYGICARVRSARRPASAGSPTGPGSRGKAAGRFCPVRVRGRAATAQSCGQYVKGLPLAPTVFLVTTTFKQLRTITRNPIHLQAGAKPTAFDSEEIEEERDIHSLIQRALTGNKGKNVSPYRQYIEGVVLGETGVLPPIHLWSETELDVVRHGASHYVVVPNGEHLLAIDGETQLTAHWQLDQMATPENRKAHREFPLAFILHHGITRSTARQYFHDLNVLAVRPNTSLGLSMDTKDPVMKVVGDLETRIPALFGQVEKQPRQLKKNSSKIATLQSLRQMVINVDKGISGVQYGARPAPIEEDKIDDLRDVALDWIGTYLNTFEEEIRNRETYLASSGPVLAAVGTEPDFKRDRRRELHGRPAERPGPGRVGCQRVKDGQRCVAPCGLSEVMGPLPLITRRPSPRARLWLGRRRAGRGADGHLHRVAACGVQVHVGVAAGVGPVAMGCAVARGGGDRPVRLVGVHVDVVVAVRGVVGSAGGAPGPAAAQAQLLLGGEPVRRDGVLRRGEADAPVADGGVQGVLHLVLGVPRRKPGLRP